jgi:hypothetical protein
VLALVFPRVHHDDIDAYNIGVSHRTQIPDQKTRKRMLNPWHIQNRPDAVALHDRGGSGAAEDEGEHAAGCMSFVITARLFCSLRRRRLRGEEVNGVSETVAG